MPKKTWVSFLSRLFFFDSCRTVIPPYIHGDDDDDHRRKCVSLLVQILIDEEQNNQAASGLGRASRWGWLTRSHKIAVLLKGVAEYAVQTMGS